MVRWGPRRREAKNSSTASAAAAAATHHHPVAPDAYPSSVSAPSIAAGAVAAGAAAVTATGITAPSATHTAPPNPLELRAPADVAPLPAGSPHHSRHTAFVIPTPQHPHGSPSLTRPRAQTTNSTPPPASSSNRAYDVSHVRADSPRRPPRHLTSSVTAPIRSISTTNLSKPAPDDAGAPASAAASPHAPGTFVPASAPADLPSNPSFSSTTSTAASARNPSALNLFFARARGAFGGSFSVPSSTATPPEPAPPTAQPLVPTASSRNGKRDPSLVSPDPFSSSETRGKSKHTAARSTGLGISTVIPTRSMPAVCEIPAALDPLSPDGESISPQACTHATSDPLLSSAASDTPPIAIPSSEAGMAISATSESPNMMDSPASPPTPGPYSAVPQLTKRSFFTGRRDRKVSASSASATQQSPALGAIGTGSLPAGRLLRARGNSRESPSSPALESSTRSSLRGRVTSSADTEDVSLPSPPLSPPLRPPPPAGDSLSPQPESLRRPTSPRMLSQQPQQASRRAMEATFQDESLPQPLLARPHRYPYGPPSAHTAPDLSSPTLQCVNTVTVEPPSSASFAPNQAVSLAEADELRQHRIAASLSQSRSMSTIGSAGSSPHSSGVAAKGSRFPSNPAPSTATHAPTSAKSFRTPYSRRPSAPALFQQETTSQASTSSPGFATRVQGPNQESPGPTAALHAPIGTRSRAQSLSNPFAPKEKNPETLLSYARPSSGHSQKSTSSPLASQSHQASIQQGQGRVPTVCGPHSQPMMGADSISSPAAAPSANRSNMNAGPSAPEPVCHHKPSGLEASDLNCDARAGAEITTPAIHARNGSKTPTAPPPGPGSKPPYFTFPSSASAGSRTLHAHGAPTNSTRVPSVPLPPGAKFQALLVRHQEGEDGSAWASSPHAPSGGQKAMDEDRLIELGNTARLVRQGNGKREKEKEQDKEKENEPKGMKDIEKRKERTKDPSKERRTYRVVLTEGGSLHFYKAPSRLQEAILALFPASVGQPKQSTTSNDSPASIARGHNGGFGSEQPPLSEVVAGQTSLNATTLLTTGLSTHALLAATSSQSACDAAQVEQEDILQGPDSSDSGISPRALEAPLDVTATRMLQEMARAFIMGTLTWDLTQVPAPLMIQEEAQAILAWAVIRNEVQSVLQAAVKGLEELLHLSSDRPSANDSLRAQTCPPSPNSELPSNTTEQDAQWATRVRARGKVLMEEVRAQMIPSGHWKVNLDLVERLARLCAPDLQPPAWVARARKAWMATPMPEPGYSSMLAGRGPGSEPVRKGPNDSDLAPLMKGWFPGSLLTRLSPQEIAQQIQSWHASRLAGLWTTRRHALDLANLLQVSKGENAFDRLISFSPQDPHPLTCLILTQLFEPPEQIMSQGRDSIPTQGARHRAMILRHWVAIGSCLLFYGDVLAWAAVAVALTSRAASRLTSSWRQVAHEDVSMVAHTWARRLSQAGWAEPSNSALGSAENVVDPILSPLGILDDMTEEKIRNSKSMPIPYLGTAIRALPYVSSQAHELLKLRAIQPLVSHLYAIMDQLPSGTQPIPMAQARSTFTTLFDTWTSIRRKSDDSTPFLTALTRSLAIEQRSLGNAQVRWRPAASTQLAANASIGLLFSCPLPHLQVLDATRIRSLACTPPGASSPNGVQHMRKTSASAAALLGRTSLLPTGPSSNLPSRKPSASNASSTRKATTPNLSVCNVRPIPAGLLVPGALCVQIQSGTLALRQPSSPSHGTRSLAQAFGHASLNRTQPAPYAAHPPAQGLNGSPNHDLLAVGSELIVRPVSESFLPSSAIGREALVRRRMSGSTFHSSSCYRSHRYRASDFLHQAGEPGEGEDVDAEEEGGWEEMLPIPSTAPTCPESPMTSTQYSRPRRLSTSAATKLSRPASMISSRSKRSSLPPPPGGQETQLNLHVEVQSATLERMVDVMVMGVEHIPVQILDSNPESSPRQGRLTLDRSTFVHEFLGTYRSLCNSGVLFDLLKKRFDMALAAGSLANESAAHSLSRPYYSLSPQQSPKSPATPLMNPSFPAHLFPSWSLGLGGSDQPSTTDCAYTLVARVRWGVLYVLRNWIVGHAYDFSDDSDLFSNTLNFLHSIISADTTLDPDTVAEAHDTLSDLHRRTMQPAVEKFFPPSTLPVGPSNAEEEAFDVDQATCHDLVDFLEPIAAMYVNDIGRQDLLSAAELLEKHSRDAMGWLRPYLAGDVQGKGYSVFVYRFLDICETVAHKSDTSSGPGNSPGKDNCSTSQLPFLQVLSPALRAACAVQDMIQKWCLLQITEPRLGLARRQSRLGRMLNAVFVCRARMAKVQQTDIKDAKADKGISAFGTAIPAGLVECALISSLMAPEARAYKAAWNHLAQARSTSPESLQAIPPNSLDSEFLWSQTDAKPCTVDMSWLLVSMAQVVTQPYEVDDTSVPLVAWDKYRLLWALVQGAEQAKSARTFSAHPDLANRRSNIISKALAQVPQMDLKVIKEDASREAVSATAPVRNKRPVWPNPLAKDLMKLQDHMREVRQASERIEGATSGVGSTAGSPVTERDHRKGHATFGSSGAGVGSAYNGAPGGVERRARRMTAIFRAPLRPMLNSSDSAPVVSSPARSAAELMRLISVSGKPSLTIPLLRTRTQVWPNPKWPFTFFLSAPDGTRHLLQAASAGDMVEIIRQVDNAALQLDQSTAQAGPTAEMPALALHSGPSFGVSLTELVARDRTAVPIMIDRLLSEIEARGVGEQGIYRISGAKSAMDALKHAFDTQPAHNIDLSMGQWSDVHTLAGVVKLWLRELPESPVPFASYHALIQAESIENENQRLSTFRKLIWEFPPAHFALLNRLMRHLALIEASGLNLMAGHNIGLVFGTSLLVPPPGPQSVVEGFSNLGKAAHIVKIMVLARTMLFDPLISADPNPVVEPAAEDPSPSTLKPLAERNARQEYASQNDSTPFLDTHAEGTVLSRDGSILPPVSDGNYVAQVLMSTSSSG